MSRAVRICTDSSAQLPADLAARLGVSVIPMPVVLSGVSYEETVDLDPAHFYESLDAGARATTSQPSPGRIAATYAAVRAEGANEIVSVHMDARASGTVDAAVLAARDAPIAVTVLDARTVSFGVAACVLEAAKALERGASVAEVEDVVAALGPQIGNVFTAAGARDGRVGGRVPAATQLEILSYRSGTAGPVGCAATLEEASGLMATTALSGDGRIRTAVGHTGRSTERAADELADLLGRATAVVEVLRYRASPSVGAHTGPLSLGAVWWPA